MSLVVCVHGIAQQSKGEEILASEWLPALRDGLRRVGPDGHAVLARLDERGASSGVAMAFYGDLYRPPGWRLGPDDELVTAADAADFDAELLLAWWQAAAERDPGVVAPDARTLVRAPRSAQAALRALSGSRFFAGVADRMLLSDAVQVRRYFTEPDLRAAIQARLEAAVSDQTRVIVAHSLGSVVAYEALSAHPEWPVRSLITLGSPLGIRNLIFDRLTPAPEPFPQPGTAPGRWPQGARSWVNVVDVGDVVALVKDLRPLFGARVEGYVVDNGARAHKISPYLSAVETGTALASALVDAPPSGPAGG